ncbi:SDR family NAD(P)-dependent oxidoreductase, partial [Acidobacteriia bacterium AH_259_A11_L15]|nr:SDR family NAD(P)-dependent oxidoreductase [Acidobacteriia bacterium AH_259_A11_L15]
MQLADRVAIITGASTGIGEALARLFAAEGARVALAARSQDKLRRLAAELGEERALAVPTD